MHHLEETHPLLLLRHFLSPFLHFYELCCVSVEVSLNIFIYLFHYFHSIQYFWPFAKIFFYMWSVQLRFTTGAKTSMRSTIFCTVVSKATKNLNLIYPLVCTSLNKLEVVQIFPWKKYVMLTKPPPNCATKLDIIKHHSIICIGDLSLFFQLKRLVCRSDQGWAKRYWRKVMVSGELFAYQSFVIRLLPQQINLSSQSNEEGCKHKYQ